MKSSDEIQPAKGTKTNSIAEDSCQLFSVYTSRPVWSGCAVTVLISFFRKFRTESMLSPYGVTKLCLWQLRRKGEKYQEEKPNGKTQGVYLVYVS